MDSIIRMCTTYPWIPVFLAFVVFCLIKGGKGKGPNGGGGTSGGSSSGGTNSTPPTPPAG